VGAGDLPCQTKNQVRRTQYWSVSKMAAGERGGDVLGGVELVAEVAGGQGQKIEQGQEIRPAKPKTECDALGIGLLVKWRPESVVEMCWVRFNG
jgi:hypothetical protein